MVVKIQKGMQEKMEISEEFDLNPIMYDTNDNKIRLILYQAKVVQLLLQL